MIGATPYSDAVKAYLMQNFYVNSNLLSYLEYDKAAKIYVFGNNMDDGIIICNAEHDTIYINTRNKEFINRVFDQLPKGRISLPAVPQDIVDILLRDKNVVYNNPCLTFAYKYHVMPQFKYDYVTEPLLLSDAAEVNEWYTYKSEESLAAIQESIATRESSCIKLDGKLASWCLVHAEDNSIGPLFTKSEYLRRGMGKAVAADLIEKLLAAKILPLAHIVKTNVNAISLFENLGFEKTHDCAWLGIENL